MQSIIIILACLAMLLAGLLGITLSVPLQAPAVILLGLAAILAAIQVLKPRSAGVWESKVKSQKVQNPSTLDNGRKSWLLGLSLGSIFYFVGRAWFSPVFDLGVEDLMLILPASILYLIGGYALRGKCGVQLRVGLAIAVIVLLLLHIGSCLFQLQGGDGFSLTPLFTGAVRSSEGHVTGMYGYYGSFANFAVIAGLLSLSLGIWGRMSFVPRGALFLLGVMALSLAVYSQSRSALVSLVPAFFVFVVLLLLSVRRQSSIIRKWVRGVAIGFSLLILLMGFVGGAWVFHSRAKPQDEGVSFIDLVFDANLRVDFWSMAGEQWVGDSVVGGGARSFSYLSFQNWSPNLATFEANPEFVHNEYLQLLTDYGLVGFILIVTLLIWHLIRGLKQTILLANKIPDDSMVKGTNAMALTMAGVCGMTAMAVHICFDFRTHLLANLLLLVCCAVWVLPVPRLRKDDRRKTADDRQRKIEGESYASEGFQPWGLAVMLFLLGFGAVAVGGQQFWAGLPLLENQMAKEDGAWVPQDVDRDVWIPALEESLRRAPQWRRYQRLGTLYRLEAKDAIDPQERSQHLLKSEQAYIASIGRHPWNPISRINLAAIYTQQKRWKEADAMYASASEMAKSREWWLRMHSKWAAMHHLWAISVANSNRPKESEQYFEKAQELYKMSHSYAGFKWDQQWVAAYSKLLISYARLLDQQKRYVDAKLLYAEAKKQPNWYNRQVDTHLDLYYSMHLYEYAIELWHNRNPTKALIALRHAKSRLLVYMKILKGGADAVSLDLLKQIEGVISFLENANVE